MIESVNVTFFIILTELDRREEHLLPHELPGAASVVPYGFGLVAER